MKIIFIFILIYSQSIAQDSLYLIFTLTGDLNNPINNIGPLGDINHDGYDDFIIRKDSTNYCEIFLGGKNIDFINTFKFPDQPNTGNSHILTNIGDINGDGIDDYAQNCFHNNNGFPTGKVFVFYGSAKLDTDPDWSIQSNCIDGLLGTTFSQIENAYSSGDVNGDKINDLLIGEPYNWCDGIGRTFLFIGDSSLSNKPTHTFNSEQADDLFGNTVANIGDINGDGFNDILIAAPDIFGNTNSYPKIFIYYGNTNATNFADTILSFPIKNTDVHPVDLQDFNGDGYDDFFVTVENKLYFGSKNFNANDTLKFKGDGKTNSFGGFVNSIGDINSDGFSDFLIADGNHLNSEGVMVGGVYIYMGSNQPDTVFDFFLEGETKWGGFGYGGSLGDINGDGYNEFYIFAFGYPDIEKKIGKVYVYSMKKFIVGVNENINQLPTKYILSQNYPNPFNPTTKIEYQIPKSGFVNISVYNILGQKVFVLVNQKQNAGSYNVNFDASNLPSGIYYYKLECESFSKTKKMLLLK